MKKALTVFGLIGLVAVVMFGAFTLGTYSGKNKVNSTDSKTSASSKQISAKSSNMKSVSSVKNAETNKNYDPNQTAEGVSVDGKMIQQVTQELKDAGLPADMWAPSDIKTIITQSSQQGVSAVDYAKQNYHN